MTMNSCELEVEAPGQQAIPPPPKNSHVPVSESYRTAVQGCGVNVVIQWYKQSPQGIG